MLPPAAAGRISNGRIESSADLFENFASYYSQIILNNRRKTREYVQRTIPRRSPRISEKLKHIELKLLSEKRKRNYRSIVALYDSKSPVEHSLVMGFSALKRRRRSELLRESLANNAQPILPIDVDSDNHDTQVLAPGIDKKRVVILDVICIKDSDDEGSVMNGTTMMLHDQVAAGEDDTSFQPDIEENLLMEVETCDQYADYDSHQRYRDTGNQLATLMAQPPDCIPTSAAWFDESALLESNLVCQSSPMSTTSDLTFNQPRAESSPQAEFISESEHLLEMESERELYSGLGQETQQEPPIAPGTMYPVKSIPQYNCFLSVDHLVPVAPYKDSNLHMGSFTAYFGINSSVTITGFISFRTLTENHIFDRHFLRRFNHCGTDVCTPFPEWQSSVPEYYQNGQEENTSYQDAEAAEPVCAQNSNLPPTPEPEEPSIDDDNLIDPVNLECSEEQQPEPEPDEANPFKEGQLTPSPELPNDVLEENVNSFETGVFTQNEAEYEPHCSDADFRIRLPSKPKDNVIDPDQVEQAQSAPAPISVKMELEDNIVDCVEILSASDEEDHYDYDVQHSEPMYGQTGVKSEEESEDEDELSRPMNSICYTVFLDTLSPGYRIEINGRILAGRDAENFWGTIPARLGAQPNETLVIEEI